MEMACKFKRGDRVEVRQFRNDRIGEVVALPYENFPYYTISYDAPYWQDSASENEMALLPEVR
jgi:hypothetical protein